jgi:hypothetical protein
MNVVDRTYDLIDRGMSSNRPPSIPSGYNKYDSILHGIRQGTYILIGGETGTGKSKFIRKTYVHNVYDHYKRIDNPNVLDVQFIDFSLEITAEANLADAMTHKCFVDHGKILPISSIFSWGNTRLSAADRTLIEEYRPYFQDFHRKLAVVDRETDPTLFHDVLMEAALSNGTFSTESAHISNCGVWTPHNPNKVIIVLMDTLNLADGTVTKTTMDAISRIGVWFRNKCNFTIVVVQQFNSDIAAVDRSRFGITTPILKDFMDSTRPTKDCTMALGLYAPYRHFKPQDPLFRGYDILKMKEWLVSLHVMKNRYGVPNACIPLKFDGALGVFSELPPAEDMTDRHYQQATSH